METRVLKADSKENIRRAATLIRNGEVVAFPTETVYGLGANATDEAAVARIFAAKGRPESDPLIVHVASKQMLRAVVDATPGKAQHLIDAFWPGPLTLVLNKSKGIPGIVTAGLRTVAVRMPRNEVALDLIREAGVPIAAPSANTFGRPSPTRAGHVLDDLGGRIPLILDGGPTQVGIESTVLDLTCSPPAVLRPGGVSRERLEEIVGKVSVSAGTQDGSLKSPGQMKQHYAPRATLLLFTGNDPERVTAAMLQRIYRLKTAGRVGVMVPDEALDRFAATDVVALGLGSFTSMDTVASRLFETMRALDREGVTHILALAPAREGIGLAVFDRLFKAAGSHLIEVD